MVMISQRTGPSAVWLVYLPLIIPALAGLAARPLAGLLEPRQATWLLTVAAVALAACSTVALGLLVAYAAARSPDVAALGDYSQKVIRRNDPITSATGAIAGLALAVAAIAVAVLIRNRAHALVEAYRRSAEFCSEESIVVVPGPAIEAYALPGRPGRIVVSDPLLHRLDAGSRAALVAHEQAHLAGRHYLFATAARLAAAANPMLLPVARAVEYTLERWADEYAAAVTGDRALVAETIGHVALLTEARPGRMPAMSLGMAAARGRRFSLALALAGPVPRRVAAMLTRPPRRRIVLLAACGGIVLLAGVAALETAGDLHALLELAQAGQ